MDDHLIYLCLGEPPSSVMWYMDDQLIYLCLGEPPPSVLWYMDDQLIDKTYIANEKGAVQNTLTIQR